MDKNNFQITGTWGSKSCALVLEAVGRDDDKVCCLFTWNASAEAAHSKVSLSRARVTFKSMPHFRNNTLNIRMFNKTAQHSWIQHFNIETIDSLKTSWYRIFYTAKNLYIQADRRRDQVLPVRSSGRLRGTPAATTWAEVVKLAAFAEEESSWAACCPLLPCRASLKPQQLQRSRKQSCDWLSVVTDEDDSEHDCHHDDDKWNDDASSNCSSTCNKQ